MGTIVTDKSLPWPYTFLLLTIMTVSPTSQRPVPQPPPIPPVGSPLRGNVWVRLADAIKSDKLCLTNHNIDDPLKSHVIALPNSPNVQSLFNDYYFKSKINSEPQELKILGSFKAKLSFNFYKSTEKINHILTPDSLFFRNASLWCENPSFRTDMKSHYFVEPKGLPQGIFLVCGDRAWAGIPSLPQGGPCTIGKLTLLDLATPTLPKRVNEDPDPLNLKTKISSLTAIDSTQSFNLLNQLDNLTCKNQPNWALAKHINPISVALQNITLDSFIFSHISPNYHAAIDYFMLSRTIGCAEKPNLCCLDFRNYPNSTKYAYYSVTELKNLLTAAKVPTNFYSKDIFESIKIPLLPNWLKQIFLICLSSAFTYSLFYIKDSVIKHVFPAKIQNKKGGDVGDRVYESMDEWKRSRENNTNFDAWKVRRDNTEIGP
ncbi:hypothetical protein BTVI_55176 [Pitangus sulphuratus]|nr:hypothetical protein BTVI_55176 [Pitangus sulphuratus]